MLEEFIDSALIIDDKIDEIDSLKKLLEEKDIWVKHYLPSELPGRKLKNRKIVFIDLLLDDSKKVVDNISTIIRPILRDNFGLNFGTYGIVLWTNHEDDIDEFKKRVKKDANIYSLPLFILGLGKTNYLKSGNFDSLFDDLNNKLEENIAASFFIKWSILVNQGKDRALDNIYSLINDYEIQDQNLQFILFQLAKNYTGIPSDKINNYSLHIDAFKAFNDMMIYEITNNVQFESKIFSDYKNIRFIWQNTKATKYHKSVNNEFYFNDAQISRKKDDDHKENISHLENKITQIYSQINSKLLIDFNNLEQSNIIPGNIYLILDPNSPFKIENLPNNSEPILIEMTPPCDFSQDKVIHPRVLGGYIDDYTGNSFTNKLKDYNYLDNVKLS